MVVFTQGFTAISGSLEGPRVGFILGSQPMQGLFHFRAHCTALIINSGTQGMFATGFEGNRYKITNYLGCKCLVFFLSENTFYSKWQKIFLYMEI